MRRTLAVIASVVLAGTMVLTSSGAASGWSITKLPGGNAITEPGINVSSNGTIFVDGPAGTPGHSKLWRSTDGAATFEALSFAAPISKLPGGGDSDVVTRGDRVFFLDLWVGSNSLSVSEDGGSTFKVGTPFTSLPASDRQWIALGDRDPFTGLDTVYVIYALIQEPKQVMLARSRTSGLTWDFHTPVPAFQSARGYTGQVISDGSKFLAVSWEDGGVLRVATSSDEGATWASSGIIATSVAPVIPGMAQDGNNLYTVWIDRDDYSVNVASSPDKGVTWSVPQGISAGGTTNMFPWIDARAGKVAVAWYGADVPSTKPDDVPTTTQWKTRYTESVGGGAFSPVVDIDIAKTGIICTGGLGCDPALGGPGGRELGDFLTVTINNSGKSLVVYGGRVTAGVRVARQT